MELYIIFYIFHTLRIKSGAGEAPMNLFYFTLYMVKYVSILNVIYGLVLVVLQIRYLNVMVVRMYMSFVEIGAWNAILVFMGVHLFLANVYVETNRRRPL
jgi:hypothetical protein